MLICNAYSEVKGEFLKTFNICESDSIVCNCGNTPETNGFFPCDSSGNEIEPTLDSNWDGLYVCAKCKEIYQFNS